MTALRRAAPQADVEVSRTLRVVIALSTVIVLGTAAVEIGRAVGTDPGRSDIVDFHAFVLVGRLVREGRLAEAYHAGTMIGLERVLGGRAVFMPYGYPPFFSLLLGPLALLPIPLAFVIYGAGTLLFFLAELRALAGPWFWTALLASAPVVFLELRIGQNGFLTAGLAGLATRFALRRASGRAGLAAGTLAALKPHLALGLPLLFLLNRDGRAFRVMALTTLVLSVFAVVLLGAGTTAAFLDGLSETGRFMAAGAFPLHRMVSVYACLSTLGVSPRLAVLLHGLVAIGVLALAGLVATRLDDRRAAAGISLMATAFLSPYLYDYDLTIFSAGLALAIPGLVRALPPRRLGLMLTAFAAAQTVGFVETPWADDVPAAGLSVGGPVLLLCFAGILTALRRDARARPVRVAVTLPTQPCSVPERLPLLTE